MSRTSAWLVVATTCLVQAAGAWNLLTLAAIAPEVGARLSVPAAWVGYYMSIAFFASMTSSLISGSAVTRWGACRAAQVGLVLVAIGAAATAVADVAVIALGAAAIGVGYGFTNPAASHILVRFTPAARRNLIFSLKQTGVPIGGMIAGLIAPATALVFGWQMAPASSAVVIVLLALVMQVLRSAWDSDRNTSVPLFANPLGSVRLVLSHIALRRLCFGVVGFAIVQFSLSSFLVTVLVESADFGLIEAGFALSLAQVAGGTGRLVWGWTADQTRDGLRILVGVGSIMVVGITLLALVGPNWPVLAVQAVCILIGFTAIGWNGVYMAELARLAPNGRIGDVTGGALSIHYIGMLAGPITIALLRDALGGYTVAVALLAGSAFIGALLAASARRIVRAA
ncbi:MAG: MFS transporter [Rhodospirillales bacterium]|nr:MFS transporter [Rhodospirillales bacterium]